MLNILLKKQKKNSDTTGSKITRGILNIDSDNIINRKKDFGNFTYLILLALCLRLEPTAIIRTGRKMFTQIPKSLKKVKNTKDAKRIYKLLLESLLEDMPFILGGNVFFNMETGFQHT